jgi:hypothetical protein
MIAWTGRFLAMLRQTAPIRFWAMVGAAVAMTIFAAVLVWIIWRGGWPVVQAARQLDILGKALWITLAMVLIIVVSLTNQKFSARGLGGSLDLSGQDEAQPAATVTTTTTTKTEGP